MFCSKKRMMREVCLFVVFLTAVLILNTWSVIPNCAAILFCNGVVYAYCLTYGYCPDYPETGGNCEAGAGWIWCECNYGAQFYSCP